MWVSGSLVEIWCSRIFQRVRDPELSRALFEAVRRDGTEARIVNEKVRPGAEFLYVTGEMTLEDLRDGDDLGGRNVAIALGGFIAAKVMDWQGRVSGIFWDLEVKLKLTHREAGLLDSVIDAIYVGR
jgi:hypothetical protein